MAEAGGRIALSRKTIRGYRKNPEKRSEISDEKQLINKNQKIEQEEAESMPEENQMIIRKIRN